MDRDERIRLVAIGSAITGWFVTAVTPLDFATAQEARSGLLIAAGLVPDDTLEVGVVAREIGKREMVAARERVLGKEAN